MTMLTTMFASAQSLSLVSMASELVALVGPELVTLGLVVITCMLFSGENRLDTYWSFYNRSKEAKLKLAQKTLELEEEAEDLEGEQESMTITTSATSQEETSVTTVVAQAHDAVAIITEAHKEEEPSFLFTALTGQHTSKGSLDVDLVAEVFLCLELQNVGQMAATCRAARSGIWEDAPLWHALGGPSFQEARLAMSLSGSAMNGEVVREQFRFWIYGLDDSSWSATFVDSAMIKNMADVMDEATYLLGGLRETDGLEKIEAFAVCITKQFALMDAGNESSKEAAIRLLEKAKARPDLLGPARIFEMQEAFKASTQHALAMANHMKMAERSLWVNEDAEESSWFLENEEVEDVFESHDM